MTLGSIPSIPSLPAFTDKIRKEFTQGSRIAADLFTTAVNIHSDVEVQPGGEVRYPIHEALNWKFTRFGRQARTTLYAALLQNEDGSTWQAKLSQPILDAKKGKPRKYESPSGGGSKPYSPPINQETRCAIAQHYGVEVPPPNQSFWDWLAHHPEIPIVITEGGKKALCLLSQGYVAVALVGVHGGYRSKDTLGNPIAPTLIPELRRFCNPERNITLAFDQDAEAKTQRKVQTALIRFGSLLTQAHCNVRVASWNGNDGKGIDDLIVNQGVEAWEQSYTQALPLHHWQMSQRLSQQLTYPVNLQLNCADLSCESLETLPQEGIIAIASPKGTGKTKFIAQQVADTPKALLASHRIALARHLCHRLNIDYRGDLDRVEGRFITGSAYTLRVGFCVDSLLAINPETFRGCDLVIDEIVQVVRHLLTSSTCNGDGKRPALLARFTQLIHVAKRVLVADADLNNATLDYLKALRGEDSECFLIHNDYQLQGYPVQFLESSDRSAICDQLLRDIQELHQGQVLYVSTDSKGLSKTLFQLIGTTAPEKRVLVINSETSGGVVEQEFIQDPDRAIQSNDYDIVICSPSVATGTSIEAQGIIAKVFGIFMGVSSTDADIAQSLARVREPVERMVWCAQRGRNYCKVSRSTNPLELKGHLFERTTTTTSLIRSSLKADSANVLQQINWQEDPHIHLYARISADQNRSMYHLRDALYVRLIHEGHQVTLIRKEGDELLRFLLKDARDKIKLADANRILHAEDLSYSQVLVLEQLEVLSPEQQQAIAKFYLKDFYCLEELTLQDILADREGRWRGELLNLEAQLQEQVALDRTVKALEKQVSWRQNLCPWDIPGTELRRFIRDKLGLTDFLEQAAEGWEWTRDDLEEIAETARRYAPAIKAHLNFTVNDDVSDVQIVHQLLSQLGVKTTYRWSNLHPDHPGEKIRVYSLKMEYWETCMEILERRLQRKRRLEQESVSDGGSPLPFSTSIPMGDPSAKASEGSVSPTMNRHFVSELPLCWPNEESQGGSGIENWGDGPLDSKASA